MERVDVHAARPIRRAWLPGPSLRHRAATDCVDDAVSDSSERTDGCKSAECNAGDRYGGTNRRCATDRAAPGRGVIDVRRGSTGTARWKSAAGGSRDARASSRERNDHSGRTHHAVDAAGNVSNCR
jgi:hypothetical protein